MTEAGFYRHFKGKVYEVISVGKHSETLEEMVVYRSSLDDGEIWVRPLSSFTSKAVVNGVEVERFYRL